MNRGIKNKLPSRKEENEKFNEFYFIKESRKTNNESNISKKHLIKVLSSTLDNATSIMKSKFPEDNIENLIYIGSLVEYKKNMFRQNILPKYDNIV